MKGDDDKTEIIRREFCIRREFRVMFELENASTNTMRRFRTCQIVLFSLILTCMTLNITFGPGQGYAAKMYYLFPCMGAILLSSICAQFSLKKLNRFGRLCTLIISLVAGFYATLTVMILSWNMTEFKREITKPPEEDPYGYGYGCDSENDTKSMESKTEVDPYKQLTEKITTNIADSFIGLACLTEATVVTALALTLFRFHLVQIKFAVRPDYYNDSVTDFDDIATEKTKENLSIIKKLSEVNENLPPNYMTAAEA